MMIPCYAQSSLLLLSDCKVYTENNNIRYDLPKYRVQLLYNYSKRYFQLDTLYRFDMNYMAGMKESLTLLQNHLSNSENIFKKLQTEYNSLASSYKDIKEENVEKKDENETLKKNNLKLELSNSSLKQQRNLAILGLLAISVSLILIK